jgi:Protein of unknown function (DUF3152)
MWLMYRGKVPPNYQVGARQVGGIAFDQLDERVDSGSLLPQKITLVKDDKRQQVAPAAIGITVDWPATRKQLERARSWLPFMHVFKHQSVPSHLKIDEQAFLGSAQQLGSFFAKPALPERIALNGEHFAIAAAEAGYQLDTAELKAQIMKALEQGHTQLNVPTRALVAQAPGANLNTELAKLQKQLGASITFVASGQTKKISRAEIGRSYEPTGQTMQLSAGRMQQVVGDVIRGWNITPANQHDAVNAMFYAILKAQPITFKFAEPNAKIRRYCVAARGVSEAVLPEYKHKLAAVYADPRGWGQGGVALVYVESGCDYTAWLSAPGSMTSFGGVCDSYYSCRSGRNVVVNFDRWMGATDPWNAAGGSLEDYRVMVINHETGHWLGFGHLNCPGPGQLAPVMQQQSISLQGCKFNPWPVAGEIGTLKQSLGIAIVHDRRYDYALASAPCSCGRCSA